MKTGKKFSRLRKNFESQDKFLRLNEGSGDSWEFFTFKADSSRESWDFFTFMAEDCFQG